MSCIEKYICFELIYKFKNINKMYFLFKKFETDKKIRFSQWIFKIQVFTNFLSPKVIFDYTQYLYPLILIFNVIYLKAINYYNYFYIFLQKLLLQY